MKLLLDTHAYLRWGLEPALLSPKAKQAMENPRNEIFVSVASLWEIAIIEALDRGTIQGPPLSNRSFGQGIIHRDLKTENVLISTEAHAKIADFGVARREMREGSTLVAGQPDASNPDFSGLVTSEGAVRYWHARTT